MTAQRAGRIEVIGPAIGRVAALLVAGLVLGWLGGGASWGLGLVAVGALIMLGFHLRYLDRLATWLERPTLDTVPDGLGAWSEVFARIYRTRRATEQNERRLQDNEERFRRTISALPEGLVLVDAALQIEWCNPVAERDFGITLAADAGLRLTNLVREPEFVDYMTSGRFGEPLVFRPMSGAARALEVRVIEFEPARSIVISRDITERERLDAVRRDFVANVSHELRTPLTVVNGFLEMLVDGAPPPEEIRRRHLGLMQEQTGRMHRLVEDLLLLSRLESDESTLVDERVDLARLLHDIADEARLLSHGRHLVEVESPAAYLRGSRDELHSAIGNLVSNAVRYTPDGGRILLRFVLEDEGCRIEVRDTGIGIPAEHLPRLTERFYRVDKSRSRETGGTGLGLAIVKHVLMRHGGALEVQSTPGEGSTFSARLPRARVEPDSLMRVA